MITFLEDGSRPKSESGSARMPLIGTNLIVVSHAFSRIMATAEDRPRSVNQNYPQESPAHLPQMIDPLPSLMVMSSFSFVVHLPRYFQCTIFVDFADLILCRPFQHAALASFMQANSF
jgi:hypothetical protein